MKSNPLGDLFEWLGVYSDPIGDALEALPKFIFDFIVCFLEFGL